MPFDIEGFRDFFRREMESEPVKQHGLTTNPAVNLDARDFADARTEQFLRHLASVLKAYRKRVQGEKITEMQIAEVGGRFILACNDDDNARALAKSFEGEGTLASVITGIASKTGVKMDTSSSALAERVQRHAAKLIATFTGRRTHVATRGWDGAASEAVQVFEFGIDTIVGFREIILGDGEPPVLTILTMKEPAWQGMHAEQKIIFACCRAFSQPVTTPIVIAGGFRPCQGCLESLRIVKRYLLPNLSFDEKGGNKWNTTDEGHREIYRALHASGLLSFEAIDEDFDENGRLKDTAPLRTHRANIRRRGGDTKEGVRHETTDSISREFPAWMMDLVRNPPRLGS